MATYLADTNLLLPLVRRLREHCDCFVFDQGK